MPDKKILVIKQNNDEFEVFWSKHMEKDNVRICSPYIDASGITHYIRAICKRSGNYFLHRLWLNDWKKEIQSYDKVILFDNCATEGLLKWISYEVESQNVILWLWNIPKVSIEPFKKYATIICFDEKFAISNDIKYVHQFYFKDIEAEPNRQKFDLSYVGSDKGRYDILKCLASYAMSNDLNYRIQLYSNNIKHETIDALGIVRSNRKISYESVLDTIGQSKAVVELNAEHQAGLTLRAMEALFLKKKLITNNASIFEYDFYNPQNIYVISGNCFDGLTEFLNTPYCSVEKEILDRYSYEDWLNRVINL